MPYIPPELRHPLEHDADAHPVTAGELNFCITRLVHHYLERRGLTYEKINEVIGALECAKLELYRRVASPYEDLKIKQNGDLLPINLKTPKENYALATPASVETPKPDYGQQPKGSGPGAPGFPRFSDGAHGPTPPARSQAAERCYRESRGPTSEDVYNRPVLGQQRGNEAGDLRRDRGGQDHVGSDGPRCDLPGTR